MSGFIVSFESLPAPEGESAAGTWYRQSMVYGPPTTSLTLIVPTVRVNRAAPCHHPQISCHVRDSLPPYKVHTWKSKCEGKPPRVQNLIRILYYKSGIRNACARHGAIKFERQAFDSGELAHPSAPDPSRHHPKFFFASPGLYVSGAETVPEPSHLGDLPGRAHKRDASAQDRNHLCGPTQKKPSTNIPPGTWTARMDKKQSDTWPRIKQRCISQQGQSEKLLKPSKRSSSSTTCKHHLYET
ncbi:hypothetical protein HOY80DRAFT_1006365 [Tuber brumale]|nr:hypothetical protein HOY80DRAFT_1006365 [Tuber brumale]